MRLQPERAIVALFLSIGCTGSGDGGDDVVKPPPKETDCSTETLIDATKQDVWVYFDLEAGAIVTPANPDDSRDWDIAFQRFKVKSNGGSSGTGGVEVAQTTGACNDLLKAPSAGYLVDRPDGDDEEMTPDYAMSFGPSSETGPWGYDPVNHQLFQSGNVFVVKSVEGNYWKLDFFEYYGPTGTAAELTFRWKGVAKPDEVLPPGVIKVDTSLMGYIHLDFEAGVIDVSDPATSMDWDVAASGPAWRTNGGLNRIGIGGARLAETADYAAITSAPTIGYRADADIPYPGPPGSGRYDGNPVVVDWFIYDSVNHTVEPKDQVFLIRGGDGSYGKLQILDYDEMTLEYRVKLAKVDRAVEKRSITVDAGMSEFAYVDLRLGEVVEVMDPSASTDWDIAFSGTRIRTNGGTSGPGEGGAAGPIAMPLEGITTVAGTFEADRMIDGPGGSYSGNPILADWFDGTQTATAPRDVAFLLHTADGGYAKMKVTSWTSGVFDLDWSYAGPGHDTF
jgi:hypothetical protein